LPGAESVFRISSVGQSSRLGLSNPMSVAVLVFEARVCVLAGFGQERSAKARMVVRCECMTCRFQDAGLQNGMGGGQGFAVD
jgi:hypothetical protein